MISRKKIISRSQSDLDYSKYNPYEVEDDIWYNVEKLYQDHVTEILRKWDQIDDEIWGKIIVMERNRRIAKAYSRVPVLSITGAEDGFDGYKIGMNGFDNPMRDALTKTVKRHIGKGVRLKMDDLGNIIIKRQSNCDVFIRGWDKENNSLSDDIIELSGELEYDKSVKLFDMKKFQAAVAHELRSAYPDRRKLESQCICAIAFVKDAPDLLDLCSWILLINIVALDLLKSRFPVGYAAVAAVAQQQHYESHDLVSGKTAPKFVSIFDQPPMSGGHHHQQQHQHRNGREVPLDEDPYSLPSIPALSNQRENSSAGMGQPGRVDKSNKKSAGTDKPPELPPRDFQAKSKKSKTKNLPQAIKSLVGKSDSSSKQQQSSSSFLLSNKKDPDKKQKEIEYEDPYYCGLTARVPNFISRERKAGNGNSSSNSSGQVLSSGPSHYGHYQHHHPAEQQQVRKAHSSGYLNSIFNRSNEFNPNHHQETKPYRGSSHYSYYDSSLESDAYGLSSGSGYDIYAPLNSHYGRVRAQLSYGPGGGGNGGGGIDSSRYGGNGPSRDQGHYRKIEAPFSYTPRYATEWD